MKNSNYNFTFSLLFLLPLIVSCQNSHYEISPLKPFSQIENSDVDNKLLRYFLVKNNRNKEEMNIDFFKSFAIKNIDTNYKSYDHYIIQFYKQTEDFNESYILDSTNININNQGRYLLYNFFWKKGQYAGYEYYVNGTLKHYKYIY